MSYSISISGHKNTDSQEESKAFEDSIAEATRNFVATLEGVTYANMGCSTGSYNLLPAATTTSTDEGVSPDDGMN